MSSNPFFSFLRMLKLVLWNRLHFPRKRLGNVLKMEDGRRFVAFRQAVADPGPDRPETPEAIFRIRFKFKSGSPERNKSLSRIPIPFIVGFPGFRSKLWTIDEENGDFQGIYEWDTSRDAEQYAESFAIRLMKKRAVPGSVHSETITGQSLDDYLASLA